MRTKKSAYAAPPPPAPAAKSNGTKAKKGSAKNTSPVQQFPLTNDMVNVHVEEEEEEYENTDMLTYQDNEEDPDFDPSHDDDDAPKKKRGRPSAKNSKASANNSVNEPKKRGRKPTFKVAEAAAAKATWVAPSPTPARKSPMKAAPAKVAPVFTPPPPTPPTSPKKKGRQPKANTANATPALPLQTPVPGHPGFPAGVSPVAPVVSTTFGVQGPNTTPAPISTPNSVPRYNYLKPLQPPPGVGVTEARLKEVEAQFALDLEKATRNYNMVVANLREEFASKITSMKAEWDAEKSKIWEAIGRDAAPLITIRKDLTTKEA